MNSPYVKNRGPRFVNFSKTLGTWELRIICPRCGAGGGHDVNSYHPKCHKCHKRGVTTYMQPASNHTVECSWKEFHEYFKNRLKDLERIYETTL